MTIKFDITGMTCAACSARVEKVTAAVPGVNHASVNLLAGTMQVETENEACKDQIVSAVINAGYGIAVQGDVKVNHERSDDTEQILKQMKLRIIGSAISLVILMYFTMGHMVHLPMPSWYVGRENALVAAFLQFMLTLPPVYLNRSYFSRGLKALYHRAPNMDSLIAVGSGAALIYGVFVLFSMSFAMGHGDWETVEHYRMNLYFESAAMILTLITVGKYLESRAKGRTSDAIRQLMDLSPKTATVKRNGIEITIPIEDVHLGEIVVVRSGGSIPVDGTILSGRGAIDQSALTGESVPVEKSIGDTVAAATINTEGYMEIRADKIGEDTTLSQIIRMVEEAGGSKAPIARLADRISGIFVPTVMSIAAVTFIVWTVAGKNFEFALMNAISVLVISCPCALGLATPVAIMVGTGRGARMGVLFKNAEALENLHHIDTVVLDKTGTLTTGKPSVTDIIAHSISADELLHIAASLEKQSEHPFAKAILDSAGNVSLYPVSDFQTLPGRGVSGIINEIKYFGGNRKLMLEHNIQVPDHEELALEGKTPLYFADSSGKYLGAIAAADILKSDSAIAIQKLHDLHLNVIMLTGDNEKTARSIAEKAGVTHIISDVMPADKAGVIAQLREDGHKVLMVGDGINDAPALAGADIGMAIGSGTDIAMESADVVLMSSSLRGIGNAISLSKATIRNIRQNLFWAFFYNCLGIPVAAGVLYPAFGILLSPMIGAAAMSLSSFFVVTNALRLRLFKAENVNIDIDNTKQSELNIKEEIMMETVIKVNGMMCPHCKARVESVCKAVDGAVDAVVDLQEKQVTVTGNASVDALKKAITDAGYEVVS